MSVLDDILYREETHDSQVFDFDQSINDTINNKIANLMFLGQIYKGDLYMTLIHQLDHNRLHNLYNPSDHELNDFYINGTMDKLKEHTITSWSFWKVDFGRKYIKVLLSKEGSVRKSPRDNYQIQYEKIHSEYANVEYDHIVNGNPRIREFNMQTSPYGWELGDKTFLGLKAIVDKIRKEGRNTIKHNRCNEKLFLDIVLYFKETYKNHINPEYMETQRSEVIRIPHRHTPINVHSQLYDSIRGTDYYELKYDTNGVSFNFDTIKEAEDFYYSSLDYINLNIAKFGLDNKKIEYVEKHYYSNIWPIAKTEDEQEANQAQHTHFTVRVQKYLNNMISELEVQHHGVFYKITNYRERDFQESQPMI